LHVIESAVISGWLVTGTPQWDTGLKIVNGSILIEYQIIYT
jgi:hypothetical protein